MLSQKVFSLINMLSLTVGITCAILLALYVNDELSFDKFNSHTQDIYRVLLVNKLPDGSLEYEGIHHPIGLGPALTNESPSIEKAVRFLQPWSDHGKYFIKVGELSFFDQVLYADFTVFDVFSFPITEGSIDRNNLRGVAISERAAKKYFGESNPISKNLAFRINGVYVDFIVTAVFKDIPPNSSIQFDVVLPFDYIATVGELKEEQNDWGFGAIITYVKLRSGVNPTSLTGNLSNLILKHYPQYEEIAKENGYKSIQDYRYYRLEPLADVHFNSAIFEGIVPSSNPMYSYILICLAIAILTIACFNFTNLSISRSANRVKEVGLRKSIGARRYQLVVQFIGESVLLSLAALITSMALVDLLLPVFNYLVEKQISFPILLNWRAIILTLSLSIILGTIAGLYPSLVISQFSMRDSLTNSKSLSRSTWFTKTLVTLQFSFSVILIIGMITIHKQVNYLKDKNLGFDHNHVISIKNVKLKRGTMFEHFLTSTSNHNGIQSMAAASQTFADPSGLGGRGFTYKGVRKRVGIIDVAGDYTETLGIRIVEGRSFSKGGELVKNEVLVNEACMKDFELTLEDTFQDLARTRETDPTVLGVMGDFNYSSLKMNILPMLIRPGEPEDLSHIFFKLNNTNARQTIAFLEGEWNKVAPDLPFEYNYLSENIAAQYRSEDKWRNILSYSMAIATLLSCMGLFAIVALEMESRQKEIGMRKILGAQVKQVIWLFTRKYLQLVALAFLIAAPISYLLSREWLSTFAYRIEMDPSIFIAAASLVLAVSGLTISMKILNTALRNPAEALRSE